MLLNRLKTIKKYSTQVAPGIGFGLSEEQKELQDLARKFTLQEVIPKVCSFSFVI
jgi:acyl-CoA dehydrogenase